MKSRLRARLGFREASVTDAEELTTWLHDHVAEEAGGEIEPVIERLESRCRASSIAPPTADRLERIRSQSVARS